MFRRKGRGAGPPRGRLRGMPRRRAALLTPDLRHAGTFQASFLVVAALPHPKNNLGFLQRARWVPGRTTLDIGCAQRVARAGAAAGASRLVRYA